jgi:tetratricopeptide (TPR) repeat protein
VHTDSNACTSRPYERAHRPKPQLPDDRKSRAAEHRGGPPATPTGAQITRIRALGTDRAGGSASRQADIVGRVTRLLEALTSKAANVADQHIGPRTAAYSRRPEHPPTYAPDLVTLGEAAAWLETERPNLHAAAAHAAACRRTLHAIQIPAAMTGFLVAHGHGDQAAALHRIAVAAARRAGDQTGQRDAPTQLGILGSLTVGYPAAAASLSQRAAYQAGALNLLVVLRSLTGDTPVAAASYQQALALATLGEPLGEAIALAHLSLVLQRTGDHLAAAASLQWALELFRGLDHRPGQAWTLNDLGVVQQETTDYAAASASLQQALELFRDTGNQLGQATALNNLGQLASRTADPLQASHHYTQALAITRGIDAPAEQARALEGLGQAHLQNGHPSEAASYLRQALAIYQHIGAPADAQRLRETLRHYGL